VAKRRRFLSNQQKANQLTANHVFQNVDLGNQTLSTRRMGLTLGKHGQGEGKLCQPKVTDLFLPFSVVISFGLDYTGKNSPFLFSNGDWQN